MEVANGSFPTINGIGIKAGRGANAGSYWEDNVLEYSALIMLNVYRY